MSAKSIILASLLSLTASAAFAGNTSALDVRNHEGAWTMSPQTVEPMAMISTRSSDAAVRSGTVDDILRKCRFVNTARSTYCDQFKQSNQ